MSRFTNVSTALPFLMDYVATGSEVPARGGTSTRERTMCHITLEQPWEREITLASRAASLPAQIAETMWVLAGRKDVEFLSHYLPRAVDFSDDGKTWRAGYGPRLRQWSQRLTPSGEALTPQIDQLAEVVRLLKDDPTTRRAVMSIFDPAVDYAETKDVPCNNWLHFLARNGVLDLHVAIRSNDLMWGWSGINQFEWSTLLEIVAGLTGLRMGRLHFSISSLHLYDRHLGKAERISKEPPGRSMLDSVRYDPCLTLEDFDQHVSEWFAIEAMIRSGDFDKDLIKLFPEPMLQSWLEVLAWWWSGDETYLEPHSGTRLEVAARLSPNRPYTLNDPVNQIKPEPTIVDRYEQLETLHPLIPMPSTDVEQYAIDEDNFLSFVTRLHAEKNAAYGDSWKRRGEMLGIMANIARKIDRLGVAGAGDTAADTAIDLFVYLCKYSLWLAPAIDEDDVNQVDVKLRSAYLCRPATLTTEANTEVLIKELKMEFDDLEKMVTDQEPRRGLRVDLMARQAAQLGQNLWEAER